MSSALRACAVNYGVLVLQALLANWIPSVRNEIGTRISHCFLYLLIFANRYLDFTHESTLLLACILYAY